MWVYNQTLEHTGRKGMKWYQRIFTEDKVTKAKGAIDASSKAVDAAKGLNSNISSVRSNKSTKKKISKMSDEDLRKRVNRLNLEQQYSRLTSEDTSKGHANVDRALSIAGGVLAIGASAASIALMIIQAKAMKG